MTRVPIERIVIAADETPELRAAVERAALVADRANRARDLANEPPNELTPATLADRAAELAAEHEHLTFEALDPDQMRELGMGSLLAVGQGSQQRAAPHRPPLRAAERDEQGLPARPRRQVDHVRHRRDLDQARRRDAGHEGRHGRRRRHAARDRRARRARHSGPRDRGPRRGREHARRRRLPARRHPPRRERQDDRGDQHRRGRAPRSRRRALVRAARGRDARARPRDADRRDGARARRLLRRRLRERRRVDGDDRRGRRLAAATTSGRSRSIRATGATSTRRTRT